MGAGNILLNAQGNIATGNITINNLSVPSGSAGGLDIKANLGGSAIPAFIIGQTSGTNGTGNIVTDTGGGGGTQNPYTHGGLYITNGTSASTGGGITLNTMSSISVKASGSRGWIYSTRC